jgi:hypothetical protein
MEPNDPMQILLDLSRRMHAAKIHHEITKYRDDGVSIIATVPGERWEIDVLGDGEIVVEVFKTLGDCRGKEALHELFARHSD